MTQSFAQHGDFPALLGKVNSRGAPAVGFILTGLLASIMLVLNYNASLANVFTFLISVVTSANLPLYLACSAAVLVLWKRGEIQCVGRRGAVWLGAAVLGSAYCMWAFAGVGLKPFLWTLGLAFAGIPFWWVASIVSEKRTLTS